MGIGVVVVMPGVRQCRAEGRAQLIVEQPDADQRHQRPARRLEPGLHGADLQARGAQQQHQHAHHDKRRERLDQRRQERQQDAAPHRAAIRQHIGGNHRLAMAGARRMQHAVGEAQRREHQRGAERACGLEAAHGRGKLAIELRLLLQHPGLRALQGAGGLRRLGARPRRHEAALGAGGRTEWVLRRRRLLGKHGRAEHQHRGQRNQKRKYPRHPHGALHSTMMVLEMLTPQSAELGLQAFERGALALLLRGDADLGGAALGRTLAQLGGIGLGQLEGDEIGRIVDRDGQALGLLQHRVGKGQA